MATALAGEQLVKAPTTLVRSVTGFAIGRVSPFGHLKPIKTFFVIDLMKFPVI
jgi:prolyl-tRNA editing enzyme YbaK/EbsC (Cys-tRNA(Pro) deacylase)